MSCCSVYSKKSTWIVMTWGKERLWLMICKRKLILVLQNSLFLQLNLMQQNSYLALIFLPHLSSCSLHPCQSKNVILLDLTLLELSNVPATFTVLLRYGLLSHVLLLKHWSTPSFPPTFIMPTHSVTASALTPWTDSNWPRMHSSDLWPTPNLAPHHSSCKRPPPASCFPLDYNILVFPNKAIPQKLSPIPSRAPPLHSRGQSFCQDSSHALELPHNPSSRPIFWPWPWLWVLGK